MTTILTYHHIDDIAPDDPFHNLYVSPESFREQLAWLQRKGIQVVSLRHVREDLLKQTTPGGKAVVITFDDGAEDVYRNAFPILKEFNFTATVFVITNTLKPIEDQNQHDHLTPEQILEMADYGIFFGSHSCSHRRLTDIPLNEARHEILDSKQTLNDLLERPCEWFSYPFGNFDLDTIELVKEAGYMGAVSAIRDNRNRPKYLYYLSRVMVMHDASLARFRYYCSRLYHYRHFLKNKDRWGKYL
jgi:peptidoglycan/xylan/chitin deacetylase (PgdA/CDA1 family)